MAKTNIEEILNKDIGDVLSDSSTLQDIENIGHILDHQKISLKSIFTVNESTSLVNNSPIIRLDQNQNVLEDNDKDNEILSIIEEEDSNVFTDINITNIDNNLWNLDRLLSVNINKLNKLFKTRSGHFIIAQQTNRDEFIKEKVAPLEIEIEKKYIDNFFINDENSIITINSLTVKDQNNVILSKIDGKNFYGNIYFNGHINLNSDGISELDHLTDDNVHKNLIGFKKSNIRDISYDDNYISNESDIVKISFISHILENLKDVKIELDFNILTPYQYESVDSQVKLTEIREGIIEGLRSSDFENGIDFVGDYPRKINANDIDNINTIINNVPIVGDSTTVLSIKEIEDINEIINGETDSLSISILQQNDINKIINNVSRNNYNNIILNENQIEDINEIINDISILANISSLTIDQKNNIDIITKLIEEVFEDKNIEYLSDELFDDDGLIKKIQDSPIGTVIPSSTNAEGLDVLETYIKNKRLDVGNTSKLESLDYKFSLLFNSLNLNYYAKVDFTNIKDENGIHIEDQSFYDENDIKFKLTNEKEVKVSRLKVLVDFAKIKDKDGYVKFKDRDRLTEEDDIGDIFVEIDKETLEPTNNFTKGRVIDIQSNITKHLSIDNTSTSRINLKPKIITNESLNIDQHGNKTIDSENIVKLDIYSDELVSIKGELVKDYFEKNKKLNEEKIDANVLESKERELRNNLISDINNLLELEIDTDEDIDLKLLNVLTFVDQNRFDVTKIKNKTTRRSLVLLNDFIEKYEIVLLNFENSSIEDDNDVRNKDIETKLIAISEYILENTITSEILKELNEIYTTIHDRLGYNNDSIYSLLNSLSIIINENTVKEPFINEHKLYQIKLLNDNELNLSNIEKDDISSDFYINSIKLKPIECKNIKMIDNNNLNLEDISSLQAITNIEEEENETIGEVVCSPSPLPFANAGDHRSILSGLTIMLDGSQSYSPEGDITDYLWEEIKDENNEQVFEFISNKVKTQVKSDELEPGSHSIYRFFPINCYK